MQELNEFWKSEEFLSLVKNFDQRWEAVRKEANNEVDSFTKSTLYAHYLLEAYHTWLMRTLTDKT